MVEVCAEGSTGPDDDGRHEVRLHFALQTDKGDTGPADDHAFLCGNPDGDHQLGTGLVYTRRSYQQLRYSLLGTARHVGH